jgi:hypothetical protein
MIADTLEKLVEKIKDWLETDAPTSMYQSGQPRKWFLSSVKYKDTLKMEDMRKATDREKLNSEYKTRFEENDPKSRKGISALKLEISQLYSFNRCLIQRYQPRLQYYRADLSQKGARNIYNSWQSIAVFLKFKQKLDV